jgi:3-oxoadipate enol-lactonase
MRMLDLDGVRLHWREDGDPAGRPVLFANSLGTDLRLWDAVIPRLPPGLRLIRYDKRGHGLSDAPPAPYAMGTLVRDAERLLEAAGARGAVVVGLSIGGMIAQGLAVKRPDLVAALVLSNTAARIGTPAVWDERIAAARAGGIEALADAVMLRWFSRGFREGAEVAAWRNMLVRTPLEGYLGCSAAISGTDFLTTTAGLRLPLLAIAGSEDGSTPPDMVRETAALVPGSRFHLIRGAGHLPCVEQPAAYAAVLSDFLRATAPG